MISVNIPGLGPVGPGDVAGVGAGLLGLVGGITAASGATAAGQAQAQGYADQAQTAGENAARTQYQLGEEAQTSQYQENALIGRQQANYGAANVAPNAGSPLDVMRDTQQQYKQQALNRFYAGNFASTTANEQAEYDAEMATAAQQAASTNASSSILGGFGSLLGIVAKTLPHFP